MRKLSIGRAPECDVQVSDDSERVSRRHAIITFSPMGKMTIYDTSSNGTFVNGEKIKKPNGVPVKRGDQINFGHAVDLDWDTIQDPYKKSRLLWLILFIVLALGIAAFFIYTLVLTEKVEEKVETEKVKTEQTDSVSSTEKTITTPVKTDKKKKAKEAQEPKENTDSKSKKTVQKKTTNGTDEKAVTDGNGSHENTEKVENTTVNRNQTQQNGQQTRPKPDDSRERELLRQDMKNNK